MNSTGPQKGGVNVNATDAQAITEAVRQALRGLSAAQLQAWGEYIASLDRVGVLLARASDAMHKAIGRQPDPASPVEGMRLDDDDAPPIADGFEPAIQQAIEQVNDAYQCLFVVAGDSLSACMVAVSEERRLLGLQGDLNER